MVAIGLLISFFLGYIWLQVFFNRITMLEKIGGAFLLGLALQTMVMVLIEMLGMPITLNRIFVGTAIFGLIPIGFAIIRDRSLLNPIPKKFVFPKISLIWILFMIVIAYISYMNFMKCVYFPTFDRDSIDGFESIGYAIAIEHCIANLTIFDPIYHPRVNSPASVAVYMPFTQLSYAYTYLLGAELSKIINAVMYLSFTVLFYAVMRRVATDTIAIIITLFMIVTPELIAWSSMSATNVLQAIFASIGVIYGLLWIKEQRSEDLYLSAVFMAMNLWSRNEGLVIVLALGAVLFLRMLFLKKWLQIIPWAIIVFIPFLMWNVYMKTAGMWSESVIITKLFWDPEKFGVMWERFVFLMKNRQYYGYSFDAFAIFALANAYFIWKKKLVFNAYTLLCIVLAFVLYFIVIYQVNYVWDSIENVLNYSAKRFFFCFIPMMWFFVGSSYLTEKFGTWLDKFQFGK
ncbi:MAG: glycosyltransferase family 39 protein [Bacteroidales bacterium]|jgi:hypothetical protein|nr:glycosyltransferase family 39 protein [Bacteroidales bacterium]